MWKKKQNPEHDSTIISYYNAKEKIFKGSSN